MEPTGQKHTALQLWAEGRCQQSKNDNNKTSGAQASRQTALKKKKRGKEKIIHPGRQRYQKKPELLQRHNSRNQEISLSPPPLGVACY